MTVSARPIDTAAEPAAQPCPCFSRRFLPLRCRRLRGATVLEEPDCVNALISRCSGTLRAREPVHER